jgi:hypothetical protein
MSLWDSIVDATGRGANKAKLKSEMLLLDHQMSSRQQAFGVELYDYVSPLTKSPDFYSSDDTLTVTLQPPLITAQREISALDIKKQKLHEQINQAAVKRAGSFKKATTWQEKLANAGKSTALAGNEAKLATEMTLLKGEITYHKQQFGISLYQTLAELEDTKQWLPTDREIRSIYDNCRKDIEAMKLRRVVKEDDLKTLGSAMPSVNESSSAPEVYATPVATPMPNYPAPAPPAYTNSSYPSARPVDAMSADASSTQPKVYATPVLNPMFSYSAPAPAAPSYGYSAPAPAAPSYGYSAPAPAVPSYASTNVHSARVSAYPSAQQVTQVSSSQRAVPATSGYAAPAPISITNGQPTAAPVDTFAVTTAATMPYDPFASSNPDPFASFQQVSLNPQHDPIASNQDPFAAFHSFNR